MTAELHEVLLDESRAEGRLAIVRLLYQFTGRGAELLHPLGCADGNVRGIALDDYQWATIGVIPELLTALVAAEAEHDQLQQCVAQLGRDAAWARRDRNLET